MLKEKHRYDQIADLAMLEQQQRDLDKSAWRVAMLSIAGLGAMAITMIVLLFLVQVIQ